MPAGRDNAADTDGVSASATRESESKQTLGAAANEAQMPEIQPASAAHHTVHPTYTRLHVSALGRTKADKDRNDPLEGDLLA